MGLPTAEELGQIMLRLAISEPDFLRYIGPKSENLSERMLPGDAKKLQAWCWFVWVMRQNPGMGEKEGNGVSGQDEPEKT